LANRGVQDRMERVTDWTKRTQNFASVMLSIRLKVFVTITLKARSKT